MCVYVAPLVLYVLLRVNLLKVGIPLLEMRKTEDFILGRKLPSCVAEKEPMFRREVVTLCVAHAGYVVSAY